MGGKQIKLASEQILNGDGSATTDISGSRLQHYLNAATSDNTRKTYRSAVRQFEKWGGRLPSDANTVIRYVLDRAGQLNPRTLDLHLTAISQWHQLQSIADPTGTPLVSKAMEGIRHQHGKPRQKAKALRLDHLIAMLTYLHTLPDSNRKLRDIAILLIGFFGAFRRSELVVIDAADLSWEPEGLVITLRKSKTDQEANGLTRALPFAKVPICPSSALKCWTERAGIVTGPIFRPINRWDQIQGKNLSAGAINGILKELGANCGFTFISELSSHSFRRGLATSASQERVDFALIKKQGGWKSDATVWAYIEEGQQFTDNASLALMDKLSALWHRSFE